MSMRAKVGHAIGTLIFFFVAPGTVAAWLPYIISRWRTGPPFFDTVAVRYAGIALIVAGSLVLVRSTVRFVLEGHGTPAPMAPPENLVVTGAYRYVRNPMYVAVLGIIVGQALLFGNVSLLGYAAVVWLAFHAFVLAYEEPTLRRRYGDAYDAYRANVPRWLPRMSAWAAPNARSA